MEKGLAGKAEAMADYETAQEMLRQSIRDEMGTELQSKGGRKPWIQ
jgi:hypothetical protein